MTVNPHKVLLFAGLLFATFFLLPTLNTCPVGCSYLYAQDAEIYIDNTQFYRSKSRPVVYFPHEIHMEVYECLYCHHDYKDGINILDEGDLDEDGSAGCARCHAESAPIGLKKAYHRQCMGCHRRINKQESITLPITCKDCHNRHSPHPDIEIKNSK